MTKTTSLFEAKAEIINSMIDNGELYIVDLDRKEIIGKTALSATVFDRSIQVNIKRNESL
jgi:hypothetical protein